MKVYKITNQDGYTRRGEEGETKWGENVTHRIRKKGIAFCSDEVFHCYIDPYLAVLMNPIHGNYDPETMQLWEATTNRIVVDDSTKSGCKTLTTVKVIPTPVLSTNQRIKIAILSAMKVNQLHSWAMRWITNQDRSAEAAWAAARVAWAATGAAWAAARATGAAWAATRATEDFDLVSIIHEVIKEGEEQSEQEPRRDTGDRGHT